MAASTLDDERLGDFTAAAESYRAFVDEIDSLRRGEVVWQLGQHLAHLYVTGLALPNVVPSDADLLESSERPNVDASELETKLGDVDQYAFVFDPWDKLD